MDSTKKTARLAGVLYLVNGVTGFFGIIYVPGRLILSGNATATAHNILASERLFHLGIASATATGNLHRMRPRCELHQFSKLKGRTKQFGRLQDTATKLFSLSITSPNPVTIRPCMPQRRVIEITSY
jgi:Domain of unknown function (DUF4386)